MRLKVIVFEGSTDEFNQVSRSLLKAGFNKTKTEAVLEVDPTLDPEPALTTAESGRFVSTKEAMQVLSRRDLSEGIRTVLVTLYEAGERRIGSNTLKEVTGYNADQFRGLMGAFGRRVVNTVPDNIKFLDYQWNSDEGQYRWTLPETAREAMRRLDLV